MKKIDIHKAPDDVYDVYVDDEWYCSRTSFDNVLYELEKYAEDNKLISKEEEEEDLKEDFKSLQKWVDVLETLFEIAAEKNKKLKIERDAYKTLAENSSSKKLVDILKDIITENNRAEKERDAAISDLNEMLSTNECDLCRYCAKYGKCNFDYRSTESCGGTWRGIEKS